MTLGKAIFLGILGLLLVYISLSFWRPVRLDWVMAVRGVTALATVHEVIPGPGGEGGVHWAIITVPRTDGTWFQGRVRGWSGRGFAVGDQVRVRYDRDERLEPRLVDRWLWKAAAASLSAHVVLLILALLTTFVGVGIVVRAAIDVRL